MPYRYMQLAVHREIAGDAAAALERIEPRDWWRAPAAEGSDMEFIHLVVHASRSQEVIDALSDALAPSGRDWRLFAVALEAIPRAPGRGGTGKVFPDSNAHGLGEAPQPLYTVAFAAADLWGEAERDGDEVMLDLWESYLEPA